MYNKHLGHWSIVSTMGYLLLISWILKYIFFQILTSPKLGYNSQWIALRFEAIPLFIILLHLTGGPLIAGAFIITPQHLARWLRSHRCQVNQCSDCKKEQSLPRGLPTSTTHRLHIKPLLQTPKVLRSKLPSGTSRIPPWTTVECVCYRTHWNDDGAPALLIWGSPCPILHSAFTESQQNTFGCKDVHNVSFTVVSSQPSCELCEGGDYRCFPSPGIQCFIYEVWQWSSLACCNNVVNLIWPALTSFFTSQFL